LAREYSRIIINLNVISVVKASMLRLIVGWSREMQHTLGSCDGNRGVRRFSRDGSTASQGISEGKLLNTAVIKKKEKKLNG
jgi:hypothetical protein